VRTDRKTNIAYSVDLVRGLDVYTADLPGQKVSATSTTSVPRAQLP
jgi:hypothetical protein